VPRIVPALVVIGLLAGTAVVFAVTERLKLVRSPILATQLDRRVLSPVAGTEVEISFRLREPDRLTVSMVEADGDVVRTLLADERRAGVVAIRWDGRDNAGRVVPEGSYKARVHLDEQRRTIELPNPMRVDTTAPRVLAVEARPRVFSPDGDGRRDKVRVSYELSEEGRAMLSVGGDVRVRGLPRGSAGALDWHAVGARSGSYVLTVAAVDRAGNVGQPGPAVEVRVRFIEVARDVYRVGRGARFRVRIVTDAASYSWRLGRASGQSSSSQLRLRAPQEPGRYALVVEANGHRARAEVIVRAG
jgi:hypothetical protein